MNHSQNQISQIILEESECEFCGSHHYKKLYAAPASSQYFGCSIIQCYNCALVRTNPHPSQSTLFDTYTDGYYSRRLTDVKSLSSRYKIFAMQKKIPFLYPYIISQKVESNAKYVTLAAAPGSGFL